MKKTCPIIWIFLTMNIQVFNLQDKNEAECKANFRVEKHHVSRLVDALDIPAVFNCQQGTVCKKSEAVLPYRKRNKNQSKQNYADKLNLFHFGHVQLRYHLCCFYFYLKYKFKIHS